MTHAQAIETHAVERYLLDEMPEADRDAFEAHYFDCEVCADDLRIAALMRDGTRAGLAHSAAPSVGAPPPPATVTAFRPRRAWTPAVLVPWAAAAVLALATTYQAVWVVPSLREQVLSTQVLVPVTLRPASRGAEPVVARPATGPVTLAIELAGVSPDARLEYDLRTPDGQSAASGVVTAPPPGAPLLLLIPGAALAADGSYVLSLRAGAGDPAATDYRFAVMQQ